jgi:dTMP kinase
MVPGCFITFEGPEGSGKSTQIRRLAETLEAQGTKVVCTREPGGTATGEAIRNILQHDAAGEPLADRAELLLFVASRAQLMEQVILPALGRGEWVLCDRFIDSTLAYQGFARGMDLAALERINDFAIQGRKPDLTLLLDLEIERGFQRLEERYADGKDSADRFEREARDFHLRVREGYRQLAERESNRFRTINSDQPIDEVASKVWNTVREALLPS